MTKAKADMKYRDEHGKEVTAKDGLLWIQGKPVELPHADRLAQLHGFYFAEQLVREINSIRKLLEGKE